MVEPNPIWALILTWRQNGGKMSMYSDCCKCTQICICLPKKDSYLSDFVSIERLKNTWWKIYLGENEWICSNFNIDLIEYILGSYLGFCFSFRTMFVESANKPVVGYLQGKMMCGILSLMNMPKRHLVRQEVIWPWIHAFIFLHWFYSIYFIKNFLLCEELDSLNWKICSMSKNWKFHVHIPHSKIRFCCG